MAKEIERAEAALTAAIHARELELADLKKALGSVQRLVAVKRGPVPLSDEFADCGIVEGATRLLANGAELTTKQIADRLLLGGIKTRAKNFVVTVHSTLKNAPKKFAHRSVGRELVWTGVKSGEER